MAKDELQTLIEERQTATAAVAKAQETAAKARDDEAAAVRKLSEVNAQLAAVLGIEQKAAPTPKPGQRGRPPVVPGPEVSEDHIRSVFKKDEHLSKAEVAARLTEKYSDQYGGLKSSNTLFSDTWSGIGKEHDPTSPERNGARYKLV
jgi:hypothetical protein